MTRCSIEPRTIKYVNGYGFLTFARKYKKQLMDTGLDASKKVVHKAAKHLGNKIAGAVTKSSGDHIVKQKPTRKRRWNIKQIEKSIIKTEFYEISKLLNHSTLSKFVTKKIDRSKWFIKWLVFG